MVSHLNMVEFIRYPSTASFPNFITNRRHDWAPTTPRGGTFLGTVKLHGSNITIVLRPRTLPQIQSRNRIISRGDDSYGASAFLDKVPFQTLIDDIIAIRGGGETWNEIILACEYCGQKIQSGVAISHLPNFLAIFNIRINGEWVGDMRNFKTVALPQHRIFNVAAVGPIFEVTVKDFNQDADVKNAEECMREKTLAVGKQCPFALAVSPLLLHPNEPPVKGPGEGIVWTLIQDHPSETLYNFKTKTNQFSTTESSKGLPIPNTSSQAFLDYACPEDGRRLEQGVEYLIEMHNADSTALSLTLTTKFISWVIKDTLEEEGSELERFGADSSEVKKLIARRAARWYRNRCATVGTGQ